MPAAFRFCERSDRLTRYLFGRQLRGSKAAIMSDALSTQSTCGAPPSLALRYPLFREGA